VNGKEVNLAQKEFDVLLFLAQNPTEFFQGKRFLTEYGNGCFGDAATVTVHIGRIREKIESDPSNPQYIETVWGAGYRLRA